MTRAARIRVLDLPDGPRRTLTAVLFHHYRLAGYPTLRTIAAWIAAHPTLPATPSKETVRRMLAGISVPLRWEIAQAVFLTLCGLSGADPDEPDSGERHPRGRTRREVFERLWKDAIEAPPPLLANPPGRSTGRLPDVS